MSKEISPITRLKSSLTYLRENEQVQDVALLNKRKEKTYHPDGYGSNPIVKKAIEDDFVMILQMKDKVETVGVTVNYAGRSLDEVDLQIGTSYRRGVQRVLTLSDKIVGMENVKLAMNNFVKLSKENPEVSLVELAEKHFGIKLSPANEQDRTYARQENEDRILKKKTLVQNKSELDFEIKASTSMLTQELSETEEWRDVQRLKKELAEAEFRLNQKRIEIQKPIDKMEHISSNMSTRINSVEREINQRSLKTTIGQNVYSEDLKIEKKVDSKRKLSM